MTVQTPEIEFKSASEIRAFQTEKLRELLAYLEKHSAYYQKVFAGNGISAADIRDMEDLHLLPFTTKDDLAENNDKFLCVDKRQVADYVTTSGTLGDPVTFYLTHKDTERLAYNEAISLQCAGGSSDSIYQLMTTIDKRFMAGLAYYLGVRKMKAGMVRVGPGVPYLQWESIRRFSPDILISTPSFIPKLMNFAEENGIDYQNSSIRSVVCIGEPIRKTDFSFNELGHHIKSRWDIDLFSTYASTEMGAAFTECTAGKGGHSHPELLILEVIDEQGRPVEEGGLGEVVVTTLGVEGMPLLRYKTGDLCHVYHATCKCGRSTSRLGPVVGRKKQMIKFKGTTIFPPAVFDVLDGLHNLDLYQVRVSFDEFGNDKLSILLPKEKNTRPFKKELKSLFKSKIRVTPFLEFIEKEKLKKSVFSEYKRKPRKIIYEKE